MKCKECLHCNVCAFVKETKADENVLQTDFKCPDYIDKNLHNKYPIKTVVNNNCEIHSKTSKDYDNLMADIKSEAIKEFAERLKEKMRLEDDCEYDCGQCCYGCKEYVPIIDNLVKEMTEVKENEMR